MADEYDLIEAFRRIEDELIASMIRNMDRHRAEEDDEGLNWTMWQAEQLKAMEKYKRENQRKYKKQFRRINKQIEELIRQAKITGNMQQEIKILQAIRKGYKVSGRNKARARETMTAEFFRLNERKLDSLVKATVADMKTAETAVLRLANDQYRKAIYNAQVYANTGAGTYEKAVDMATKDMLAAGLNCVVYANGARHTLADYADMAIRTASKRAYLAGEGEMRQEWGISTVIVNKRGNPCPKCLPFCGKVLIDDVWSGGSTKDGDYPLMSYAISKGLYHPRCKDIHTTYFPGISTADDSWTEKELAAIGIRNKKAAEGQYAERQAKKYERLAKYSLDKENKQKYGHKSETWKRVGGDTNEEENIVSGLYSDVTDDWKDKATPKSHEIIDLEEYKENGVTYKVDGKHVLLDYKESEKRIAELLRSELGGEIFMVPRVLNPKGVSTPDYIFRGERFDLKELAGTSKNLIYNAIAKKKRQANNFILDISQSPLEIGEIYKQVAAIYQSNHTRFVDKLIIVKDNKVLRIFCKKKI